MGNSVKRIRPFAIDCGGPSRTIESHAEGNTVPEIVARFSLTGVLPQTTQVPQFFDLTQIPTLLESLNTGARFNSYFSQLDAKVRDEFHNDPKRLMSALSDPKFKDRLVELGILKSPPKVDHPLGSKENPIHQYVPPVDLEKAPPPTK